MFLFGLLAAILGNCAIGTGQTLQKYALNHLASLTYLPRRRPNPATGIVPHAPAIPIATRLRNRTWLTGLLMTYLGEACGNWIALSFVSAAVVTPLGIVAVIVNAVLANRYLGEQVGRRQRRGYALVALGVLVVLIAAPKQAAGAEYTETSGEVLRECCGTRSFFMGLGILISAAGAVMTVLLNAARAGHSGFMRKSRAIGGKNADLYLHVAVCSLLGGITITCGKILSVLARLQATQRSLSIPAAEVVATTVSKNATATISASDTTIPAHVASNASAVFPLFCILVLLVCSIIATEYFRQQAYARYPVSRFQPLMYAGVNGCAVLSNVILFHELPTTSAFLRFFVLFGCGMTIISMGLKIAQKDDGPGAFNNVSSVPVKTARRA
ncbi:hypothetical protein DFJ77DRAFT_436352 [Powellomyces hirtus]|nr:hypothetical protein DFJ77DRAFT_436352 [Powellomyces hirtus]